MVINNLLLKKGYFIYKLDTKEKKSLINLRRKIYSTSKKLIKTKLKNPKFFDSFHEHNILSHQLNNFRMHLMEKINTNYYGSKAGFEIFSKVMRKILGDDIVTQKNINLVIQCPNDQSQQTVHRDAPPNSDYELVVWVPLTRTYKTKNMYILDKENTFKIYADLRKSIKKKKKNLVKDYYKFAFKNANKHNINFGEAIIFWAPLVHCVGVNLENETRWSLNFRYKNTFTPYGTKKYIDYFDTINSSTISKLILEKEEKQFYEKN